MNGIHDLGGMHGFGPVVAESNEPVFHEDWERRIFAMSMAMRIWRLGNVRTAWEQMPPAEYLATSYYEHWLFALLLQLEQSGLLDEDEVERLREAPETVRIPLMPSSVRNGALRREDARALGPSRGGRLDDPAAPRFAPGQAVLTRNIHPIGHTRLPRYARARRGFIDCDYGVFAFPDSSAVGGGQKPQHVYSVRFDARELWGPGASAADRIYIDLWDDYLDPA
ncbi:MAG: nitrile hydratase subunit beta [Chloroflexi bacterium]|nr:nitrile hydratase subunit beta [Chloroflexota bacterium]